METTWREDVPWQMTKESVKLHRPRRSSTRMSSAFLLLAASTQRRISSFRLSPPVGTDPGVEYTGRPREEQARRAEPRRRRGTGCRSTRWGAAPRGADG